MKYCVRQESPLAPAIAQRFRRAIRQLANSYHQLRRDPIRKYLPLISQRNNIS
jgi:hypothetical protein